MNRRNFITWAGAGGAAVASGHPLVAADAAVASRRIASEGGTATVNRGIIRVCCVEQDPTVLFAADELVRCLQAMCGATVVRIPREKFVSESDTLWLGCVAQFPQARLLDVPDLKRDDAIHVQVEERRGIIVGANPRAVLLAVYRYLTELGCHWVRPGRDGEFFPAVGDPLARLVRIVEKPSYRHRGFCIEGACSSQHVIDLVDWLPKVGMNSYFIEYLNGYIYYNNWYSERHKVEMRNKLMPEDRANEFAERAIEEMKKRGLLIHRVGHGWTSMPLGIPSEVWDEPLKADFGDLTRYIAEYRGKRQLYNGIPRRTHLCYSQPAVRTMMAREVVKYALAHPEVDYLHLWLADGANHCCECAECRKARPADFYVMILNETDELLTAQNLPVRIAFLAYADLLWPPEKETIRNPDRFLMMFATLARSYFEPFHPEGLREPVPPFTLNQLKFPPSQNLNFLAAWQKVFRGDSFIYDYRFMWGQYDDPGFMELAAATALDIPSLAEVGLNGLISDQTQRAFLPTGLPMTVMARKLWRSDLPYETIARDYFDAAFGAEADLVRAHLARLSKLFDPRWLATYHPVKNPPASPSVVSDRLRQVRQAGRDFKPVIERNRQAANECHAKSWAYLALHTELCELLAKGLEAEVAGSKEEAIGCWKEIEKFVVAREGDWHPVFDVCLFLITLKQKHQFYRPGELPPADPRVRDWRVLRGF